MEYVDVFLMLQEQSMSNRLLMYMRFLMPLPVAWLIVTGVVRRDRKALVGIFFVLILVTVFKPSRGLISAAFIVLMLSYHYYRIRLTATRVVIGMVILGMVSFGLIRYRSYDFREASAVDAAFRVSEGTAVFENTYIVYNYVNDTGVYRWGSPYLRIFLQMVPQWILPFEKQPPLSIWLLQEFFPDVERVGGGRMFSIVADGYMNYSFAGPILLGALFAYFLKLLYVSFVEHRGSEGTLTAAAIAYLFICSQVYFFIRGDLASFVVRLESYSVVPVLFLVIFSRTRRIAAGTKAR
jgi:oligosaccharide repeat unit polymerase